MRAVPPVGEDGRLLLPQGHVETAVAQVGHWQGALLHGLRCLEDAPVRKLCRRQLAAMQQQDTLGAERRKQLPAPPGTASGRDPHQAIMQGPHKWSPLHVCSKLTIHRACVLLAGPFGFGRSQHLLVYNEVIHLYRQRGHSSPSSLPGAPCLLGSWRCWGISRLLCSRLCSLCLAAACWLLPCRKKRDMVAIRLGRIGAEDSCTNQV